MPTMHTRKLKENPKSEKIIVRMTPQELIEVKRQALTYCDGNLSKWLRDRGMKPMLDISLKMQDAVDRKE